MSKIRVLVGTRKGAFILSADGTRKRWKVNGPHFAGWEIYHVKGSPVDPNRIYASQTSGWFGQIIQRSDNGGKTWNTPGSSAEELKNPDGMSKGESNKFVYDTSAGTTEHSIHGSSNASGIWNRRWAIRTPFTPASKMRPYSVQQTAASRGTNWPACAAAIPDRSGNLARAECVCTRFFSIRKIENECSSRSRLRVHFAPMMPEKHGAQSIAGCTHSTFPIRQRKLVTASIASRCTRRVRTRYSCKSTGT